MRDAMDASRGIEDVKEENWRLRQRLHYLESNHRLLERQNRALQRRVAQLEAQSGQEIHHRQLVEHDSNVRGLLRIIRHHEAAQIELQMEVERLQAKEVAATNTTVKVSRSSQTECYIEQRLDEHEHGQKDASAYLQHLYQKLQQPSVNRSKLPIQVRHSASIPSAHVDFRSSVMKRLSQGRGLPDYPPSIPEESEEDQTKRDLGIRSTQAHHQPPTFSSHLENLEEQNRQLRERLNSQQTLLDQLLNIKLDNATAAVKLVSELPTIVQEKTPEPALVSPLPPADDIDSKNKKIRSHAAKLPIRTDSTVASMPSRPMSPPVA